MVEIVKKILGIVLAIGIILSSAGVTILNHICKEEQKIFVSIEEFYESKCQHHSHNFGCCDVDYSQTCSHPSEPKSIPTINSNDNCCSDTKIFSKIDIATNEKNLKKFTEKFKLSLRIEYIKSSITNYFKLKYEQVQVKIINPIQKIVRFIQLITHFILPTNSETLH
ncbi:MAG: hypothetical protein N2560_06310 [Ignavibacteria bacterium]|nr:hypothetical protein [Ignavibacteria bacterium]